MLDGSEQKKNATALTSAKVGLFLAVRDIRRANIWTTGLIIIVMMLTFLNLIVVSGILVGLVEGINETYNERFLGDVIVSSHPNKRYIENSANIIRYAESLPQVEALTARFTESGKVEANYRDQKRPNEVSEFAGGIIAGIDPVSENAVTGLSKLVIEGSFLEPDDYDEILIGANMLYKYNDIDSADVKTLKDVEVGSKVRLIIATTTREVTIKGVVKSKLGEIDQRIFMVDSQLRTLIDRFDHNVGEIAIRLKPGANPEAVRDELIAFAGTDGSRIKTWTEGQPKFVADIRNAMALMGNIIGSIGLVVASITIFIVIFVNAITRRRYIGIMKGIGVDSLAIEVSYILQSLFYAGVGMLLGTVVIFGFLKPYIAANPINFPFSDGILVATPVGTAIRAAVLLVATIVAGYLPAKIVVRQNTLNAILGR